MKAGIKILIKITSEKNWKSQNQWEIKGGEGCFKHNATQHGIEEIIPFVNFVNSVSICISIWWTSQLCSNLFIYCVCGLLL